ncbi:putative DNA replication protein kinase [Encephalitozoon hellem ATCC 50504]|uniref:Zinc-finger domain-containing protein n=1 Tax=Encephalitozoon hellem TaxID=27973 RepID=A0A9Q9C863_ENCHE|nr:putative DNA replication protein kinase [Encephalitozoon hellem ATCC 50504]AFM98354.1 putative DNA replication protein kinase [Encephalitozoon hellem ATCC 50504]UTX43235.1 zinc-finger domain-containing protein [Encephalitozoon hellem]WEL38693.1 zinc-finger domain-containing protein [Encephalitozoon hellem]|eukprot:XP_003887335.1 putative DNA replication protein kinase [Encephalitozoon hellem ATCC 50504]
MKSYKVFKKPYILIEDTKNKYQPFYKEYANSDAPKLHLDSPTLCCPFQAAKKYKQSGKRRHTREGFCEVCYVRFSNYEEHIKEFEHREFARDNSNYKKLDVFISTSAFENTGPSEEYVPQSPTFKLTPASSERKYNGTCLNDNEKCSQTLHFSLVSTEGCLGQDAMLFDHFIAEIFDK